MLMWALPQSGNVQPWIDQTRQPGETGPVHDQRKQGEGNPARQQDCRMMKQSAA
jgi:hypothetical protein